MAIELAREYLKKFNKDNDIMEFEVSSATVELAAKALGVEGALIAKTLSFCSKDGCIIIVTAGDGRIDNKKFKSTFGLKAKMLTPEQALEFTGHAIGGVCPFGLISQISVYIDVSIKRFEHVYPACGSSNSAIKLTPDELFTISQAQEWVDICTLPI